MKCKLGDLAIVLRTTEFPDAVGMIVQCVSFAPYKGKPAWKVDPPLGPHDIFKIPYRVEKDWIFDSQLRPLNNPSDDEVDETLCQTEKEHV